MKNDKALQKVIDDSVQLKKCYKKGKLSTEQGRMHWHLHNNIINAVLALGASKKQLKNKAKIKDDC